MEFQPEDVPGWALIHVARYSSVVPSRWRFVFFVRYSGVGEDVLETEKPIFIPLAVDDKSGQRWAASLNVLFLSNNIYNFAELPGRDFTFDSCAHNTDFVTSYFWAKQSNPLFMFQECPKKCHCCLIKLPTVKFVEKQQVELMAV